MTDRKVYNKRHKDVPPDAVYVGRPTKWGNPFSHQNGTLAKFKVKTREEAVAAYIDYINETEEGWAIADAARSELRDKDLVCWCAPKPCHADILLEIANADPNNR